METTMKIFEKEEFGKVRVVEVYDEPWFVAKDVALALGYPKSSLETIGKLFGNVPAEWADRKQIPVRSESGVEQMREVLIISEQGLYFFLGRSDKPAALPYQKWIAGDVVPSIRKHGGYLTPAKIEETLLNPDTIIRLATALKSEQEKCRELEARIEADKPKVAFAEAVTAATKATISVGELAKLIRQTTGMDIGQNRLFDWLRRNGYLHKYGTQRNLPTKKSAQNGLIVFKESISLSPRGDRFINRTARITGKGQRYFIDRLLECAIDSKSIALPETA